MLGVKSSLPSPVVIDLKLMLCGCHRGKVKLHHCVVELEGIGHVLFFFFSFFFFFKSLLQNCHFWRLYKEMGDENPLISLEKVYMLQEGGDFWSFQYWCSRPKSCLLHPSLTSVIPTMHPTLKAGSSSQVFFLSCWLFFFFIGFLRIFNCRG